MTEVRIIFKPVHWFAVHMIETSVAKELNLIVIPFVVARFVFVRFDTFIIQGIFQ